MLSHSAFIDVFCAIAQSKCKRNWNNKRSGLFSLHISSEKKKSTEISNNNECNPWKVFQFPVSSILRIKEQYNKSYKSCSSLHKKGKRQQKNIIRWRGKKKRGGEEAGRERERGGEVVQKRISSEFERTKIVQEWERGKHSIDYVNIIIIIIKICHIHLVHRRAILDSTTFPETAFSLHFARSFTARAHALFVYFCIALLFARFTTLYLLYSTPRKRPLTISER